MEDDIDIEEHDVLDNPVIKSIFPDISVIKKEISKYFEEEPDIEDKAVSTEIKPQQISDLDDPQPSAGVSNSQTYTTRKPKFVANIDNQHVNKHPQQIIQSNKIILGSKPNNVAKNENQNLSDRIDTKSVLPTPLTLKLGRTTTTTTINQTENEGITPITGKLMVGGNGTKTVKEVKVTVREMKLQLQDIKSYLDQNARYCKQCCTLFLSKSNLAAHMNEVHNNITTKDKNINNNTNIIGSKCKCQTCGLYFTCISSLKRHYNNIHKKHLKLKTKGAVSSQSQPQKSTTNIKNQIKTRSGLHQVSALKAIQNRKTHTAHDKLRNETVASTVNSRDKNLVCVSAKEKLKATSSKIQLSYNKITKKKSCRRNDIGETKHKCKICAAYFSSSGNLSRHYKNVHKNVRRLGSRNTTSLKTEPQKIKLAHNKVSSGVNTDKRHKLRSDTEKYKTESPKYNDDDDVMDLAEQLTSEEEKQVTTDKEKHVTSDKKKQVSSAQGKRREPDKDNTSKYDTRSKNTSYRPYKDRNVCLHCNKSFADQKSLIKHMYEILAPKRNSIEGTKNSHIDEKQDDSEKKKENDAKLFVCRHCSFYLPTIKAYFVHMIRNHKIEVFLEVKKEKFNSQCKYCPSKSINIPSHNKHIRSYHRRFIFIKVENEIEYDKMKHRKNRITESETVYENIFSEYKDFALESVVFECSKCSVCFLSSSIARNHKQHMELLVNWKCSICHQILKDNDKELHLKQHSLSTQVKVLKLNETSMCNVLYNCTKCAIHFTEKRYQEHYRKCETEPTDSSYCKICDVLIDRIDMTHHETKHETYKNVTDFTIIDSNIIVNTVTSHKRKGMNNESEVTPRKTRHEQYNCYTYCGSCKCYLSDVALKRKVHINGACSHIQKHVCNQCGLVLTNKTLSATHRPQHKSDNNLRLQDFKFFDLQGKQILPPIPEYPHCEICEIHFLTKTAIISHMCDETDFLTCDICNIKLSETAYKLHMSFHFYFIQKGPKNTTKPETYDTNSSHTRVINAVTLKHDTVPNDNSLLVVYSCKKCNITVSSYDEVIEHCHAHYSITKTKAKTEILCKKCSLKFDSLSYMEHQKTAHSGAIQIKVLKFDPCYFPCDNNIWTEHIFQTIPEMMVSKHVAESIYKEEHRIKLERIQKGSSQMNVYKCGSCGNIIDSACVYKHAKKPCGKVRIHPCSVCGLPLISISSRYSHEKLHKRKGAHTLKSLNIILFNQSKDKAYNNSILCMNSQYILYQCRACDRVAAKSQLSNHHCDRNTLRKCVSCGLLFSQDDYLTHVSKHTDLGNFCASNFKVILFGIKSKTDANNVPKLSPSFSGTVYDYTLYKCLKCEMCLKNIENSEKHTCTLNIDLDRSMCTECDLYFPSRYLKLHMKQHSTDPDFLRENLNVITFNGNPSVQTDSEIQKTDSTKEEGELLKTDSTNEACEFIKTDSTNEACEFIKTDSTSKAGEFIRTDSTNEAVEFITEQTPSKSVDKGLDINDDDDGKEYTVVDRNEKSYDKIENDERRVRDHERNTIDDEENIDCVENTGHVTDTNKMLVDDNSVNNNDDNETIIDEEPPTLYKCNCGLHFTDKLKVDEHFQKCNPKTKQCKQNCSKCHLLFNPSELFSHLLLHHKNKTQVHKYNIIDVAVDDGQK